MPKRSVKGLLCEFLQVAAHLCLVQTGDFSKGIEALAAPALEII